MDLDYSYVSVQLPLLHELGHHGPGFDKHPQRSWLHIDYPEHPVIDNFCIGVRFHSSYDSTPLRSLWQVICAAVNESVLHPLQHSLWCRNLSN